MTPFDLSPVVIRSHITELNQRLVNVSAHSSADPKTNVYCRLLSTEGRTLSTGFNSAPRNLPMRIDRSRVPGYVLHAEEEAVALLALGFYGTKRRKHDTGIGRIAIINKIPCSHCVSLLNRVGVEHFILNVKPSRSAPLGGEALARSLGLTWLIWQELFDDFA